MPELVLQLAIPAPKLHAYYRGTVRSVQVRAVTGQLVQFPASALQRHFTAEGVHGRFRMEFDENHKFVSLDRIEE